MPFKKSRFVVCCFGNCYSEPRAVRKPDGCYDVCYQDPRHINLPKPAESNLGLLLDAGVKLDDVRTAVMIGSDPLVSNVIPKNENEKEK